MTDYGLPARDAGSLARLLYWTGAWLVTLAIAAFGPNLLWEHRWVTLLAILVNLAVGLAMIWASVRRLKEFDELMQRIQLEAMGFALGVGVVLGLSYSLLETAQLVPFRFGIPVLVVLMGLTYIAAAAAGAHRYR